jgi:hypothetical protein
MCTCQIWNFLILRCSTCWENSRDYKFVIFGHLVQKIWIKQTNRIVWFNLKIVSIWILNLWNISALINSTCSKDSSGILFVIFGCRDQKIWIIQEWTQFWFLNSNLNLFWSGAGHVSRFNSSVPVRVDNEQEPSDVKWSGHPRLIHIPLGKWSVRDHWIQIGWTRLKGEGLTMVRVRVSVTGEKFQPGAARVQTPACFWWFLGNGETTMKCGRSRRSWERDRRSRSRPTEGEGGG